LREILAQGSDKVVILRGDRSVPLGEAVYVMSVIKKAGASEIAIAAQADVPVKPARK
jgi:biopolymer transport protein ExbD